jgi:hypothetical protein
MSDWIDYVHETASFGESDSRLAIDAYTVDGGLVADIGHFSIKGGFGRGIQLSELEIELVRDALTRAIDANNGGAFPGKHVREPGCCAPFDHRPQGYTVCHVCGTLLEEDERVLGRCENDLFA